MHRCYYIDRITVTKEKIIRTTKAIHSPKNGKERKLDVCKTEYDIATGETKYYFRHITYLPLAGHLVFFPGEIARDYCYHSYKVKLEKWRKAGGEINVYSDTISEKEKEEISKVIPEFKYVLKKWTGTKKEVLNVLPFWLEHKEVEFILACGFYNIAVNKSFYRLTPERQKEVCSFIQKHKKELKDVQLAKVLILIKHNITPKEYEDYCYFKSQCYGFPAFSSAGYKTFKYLVSKGLKSPNDYQIYSDYLRMIKQLGKTGDYWFYPKNLYDAHTKVQNEIERLERADEAEKFKKYEKVIRKYKKYNSVIAGYSIYIPDDISDIKAHAKQLNQCLIGADYIGKVISKRCLLVFIKKGTERIATAEVLPGKKLGQFYGNELDRNNCLPSDGARNIFNKWFDTVSIPKKAI